MPCADPRPFVCAQCGKSFGRKFDFSRHAQTHAPRAPRYYCAYPGCDHSSLQKSNLKTHYIAKHLNQKPNQCKIDGCTKAYGDASALIRHEKKVHEYYRKAQRRDKPYARLALSKTLDTEFSLDDSVYVRRAVRKEISPAPSLSYSISPAPSPDSTCSPTTPTPSFCVPSHKPYVKQPISRLQTSDEFLHKMIPEFFPDPKLAQQRVSTGWNSGMHVHMGMDQSFYQPESFQPHFQAFQTPLADTFTPMNTNFYNPYPF